VQEGRQYGPMSKAFGWVPFLLFVVAAAAGSLVGYLQSPGH